MSAFTLGRLAENADNQTGILNLGSLSPLLDLLESENSSLQDNAIFTLHRLASNPDNAFPIIMEAGYHRLLKVQVVSEYAQDHVRATIHVLGENLHGRILNQLVFQLRSQNQTVQYRAVTALARLSPVRHLRLIFLNNRGLDLLTKMITSRDTHEVMVEAATAMFHLANKVIHLRRTSTNSLFVLDQGCFAN